MNIFKAFMDKPKLPLGLNVLAVIVSLVVVAVVVLERLNSSYDVVPGDASATTAVVFTCVNASTLLLHLPAAAAPVRVSFTAALPSAAAAGAWASSSPAVPSVKELAAPLLATLTAGLAVLPLCALAALGIERLAARSVPPQADYSASSTSTDSSVSRSQRRRRGAIAVAADWAAILLHATNTSASLVVPHAAIALAASSPLKLPIGVALSMLSIIVWMKLVSYAHCNACLRAAARSGQRALTSSPSDAPLSRCCSSDTANSASNDSSSLEAGGLAYPRNLTLRDTAYYLAAPTLTYQPGFPLSPGRPRLMWLLRRAIELAATCAVIVYLSSAHVAPLVRRSASPLALLAQTHAGLQQSGFEALLDVAPQWCQLLATLLRLSMFTLTVWLCMFYALFHLWLNMLAEALR
ncbi:MAG: hypothetical protein VKM97_07760, partial [Cyanobacteriota bacterium]|nr:hypothetical protein [Cyanobacteriota bacterium]